MVAASFRVVVDLSICLCALRRGGNLGERGVRYVWTSGSNESREKALCDSQLVFCWEGESASVWHLFSAERHMSHLSHSYLLFRKRPVKPLHVLLEGDRFDARCLTWLSVSLIQAAAVWDTASARLLWQSTKTQSPNKHFQSRAWQTLFNHRGSSSCSLAEQFKDKILSWWSKQDLFILSSIWRTFAFCYVLSAS